LAFVAVTVKV
jgi:hypothetical protein